MSRYLRTDNALNQQTTDRVQTGEDQLKTEQHLAKLISTVSYSIASTKSDQLELRRDLATYEQEFSQSAGLEVKLIRLNSLASSLPDIFETLEKLSNTELNLLSSLKDGLQEISEGRVSVGTPEALCETFGSRRANSKSIINYFTGVYVISALHCFVRVVGDSLARSFSVNVQTVTGEEYMMKVEHKVNFDPLRLKAVAKSQLLCYFYFTHDSKEFSLNFDTRCSSAFSTVVAEVQGSPVGLNVVIVTQENFDVRLVLMEPPAEITVPTAFITEKQSVFEVPLARLAKVLRSSLHFLPGSNGLKWKTGSVNVYKFKDKQSNFMNDKYVKDMIEANYSLLHSTTISLNDITFSIEFCVYQDKEKLRIRSPIRSIDLSSNSPELHFLKNLQFSSMKQSLGTMVKSLEMKNLVQRLFPQYFL
jgi:hypothetical protein